MRWLGRGDRDYREELDAHLEMEVRENLDRGMTPDEARQAALQDIRERPRGATAARRGAPPPFLADGLAGCPLRDAAAEAQPGPDRDECLHPGPGHRSQCGHLQPGRGRAAADVAGARAAFAGHRPRVEPSGRQGYVLAHRL